MGRVIDENKDVIQGVEVTLLQSANSQMKAITDEEGLYTLKPLPPGTYSLQVKFKGYRAVVIKDIWVIADQGRTANIKLAKSGSAKMVDTIKWESPFIDPKNIPNVFDPRPTKAFVQDIYRPLPVAPPSRKFINVSMRPLAPFGAFQKK